MLQRIVYLILKICILVIDLKEIKVKLKKVKSMVVYFGQNKKFQIQNKIFETFTRNRPAGELQIRGCVLKKITSFNC